MRIVQRFKSAKTGLWRDTDGGGTTTGYFYEDATGYTRQLDQDDLFAEVVRTQTAHNKLLEEYADLMAAYKAAVKVSNGQLKKDRRHASKTGTSIR